MPSSCPAIIHLRAVSVPETMDRSALMETLAWLHGLEISGPVMLRADEGGIPVTSCETSKKASSAHQAALESLPASKEQQEAGSAAPATPHNASPMLAGAQCRASLQLQGMALWLEVLEHKMLQMADSTETTGAAATHREPGPRKADGTKQCSSMCRTGTEEPSLQALTCHINDVDSALST